MSLNKIVISLFVTTLSINAYAYNHNQVDSSNKIQTTKKMNSYIDDANHQQELIDSIELSITDKERAKNFKLSENEYKQYKYLIEYTPRGNWTKDIDPVLALGVTANTEYDRMKYAEILYQQRKERETKEVAFALALLKTEKFHDPNSPRWKTWHERKAISLAPHKDEIDNALQQSMPKYDTEQVSIFVNSGECVNNSTCLQKMINVAKSKLDNTNITFYLVDAIDADIQSFTQAANLEQYNLNSNVQVISSQNLSGHHPKLPFLFIQNKNGDKVRQL